MRTEVQVEEMAMLFSSITVDDDEMAQGVQTALRWVLYGSVPDSDVTGCLPE